MTGARITAPPPASPPWLEVEAQAAAEAAVVWATVEALSADTVVAHFRHAPLIVRTAP